MRFGICRWPCLTPAIETARWSTRCAPPKGSTSISRFASIHSSSAAPPPNLASKSNLVDKYPLCFSSAAVMMPLTLKTDDERPKQAGPMGMAMYPARPASPRGSATRMINVLSEPHLPMSESLYTSPHSAVTRLQQTLDKSDTKVFTVLKYESEGSETSLQLETGSSESSIRVATYAARGIVAGLFGRRKRSAASLTDGKLFDRGVMKWYIIPNYLNRKV